MGPGHQDYSGCCLLRASAELNNLGECHFASEDVET